MFKAFSWLFINFQYYTELIDTQPTDCQKLSQHIVGFPASFCATDGNGGCKNGLSLSDTRITGESEMFRRAFKSQ